MKNVNKSNPFQKINAVYIILYAIYFIYFLNTLFTWPKAIILGIGILIAFALLIIETYHNHKN